MVPFLEDYVLGRMALNAINILILFSAAVAVSDSRACFALAVIFGVASIGIPGLGICAVGAANTAGSRADSARRSIS